MVMSKKKIARNAGKIEFMVVKQFLSEMLEQGHNLKNIYKKLMENKEITMSYAAFCYHFRIHLKQHIKRSFVTSKATKKQSITDKHQPSFVKPEDVDIKSLY